MHNWKRWFSLDKVETTERKLSLGISISFLLGALFGILIVLI